MPNPCYAGYLTNQVRRHRMLRQGLGKL